jgi:hypothetical protein
MYEEVKEWERTHKHKQTHSPTIANDQTSDFLLYILFAIDSGAIQHTGPTPLVVYIMYQINIHYHFHYQCWIFKSIKTHFIHFCFNWYKVNVCRDGVKCVVLCCVVTFPSSVLSRIRDIPKSYVYVQHNTQQSERVCKQEIVEVKEKREKKQLRKQMRVIRCENEKERDTESINITEILGFPLPVSKMFREARSQWTILCLWRWYIPNAIPSINSSFRSFDNISFESYNNLSKLPVLCCVVLCYHSFIHIYK